MTDGPKFIFDFESPATTPTVELKQAELLNQGYLVKTIISLLEPTCVQDIVKVSMPNSKFLVTKKMAISMTHSI